MPPQLSQLLGNDAAVETKLPLKITRTPLQQKRAQERSKTKTPVVVNSFFNMVYGGNSSTNGLSQQGQNNTFSLQSLPLSTSTPTDLASQCITAQIEKDNSLDTLFETFSKYVIDNYNFNPKESLGNFKRFEKSSFYSLPERMFQESGDSKDSIITNMGILPQLNRVWFASDSKLFVWNYTATSMEQEFDIIDDFNGTILACELVKPKKDIFVESVNYILLVSTSKEIKMLTIEYNDKSQKLIISDPKMSVPTHGLLVNKFATFDSTGDIFFAGSGTGESIWKLNYNNSNDWFSKPCSKECLTGSTISTVLPNIPIFNFFNDSPDSEVTEILLDICIDQERKILYTLSSKSILRTYQINTSSGKGTTLGNGITKTINGILKDLSTTPTVPVNISSPLLRKNQLKLIKMAPISKSEDTNLFIVLVASNGCRFYIKGSKYYDGRVALNTAHVKFPPIDLKTADMIEKRKEKLLASDQSVNKDSMYESLLSMNQPTAKPVTSFGLLKSSLHSSSTSSSTLNSKSITKNQSPSIITLDQLKLAQESSDLLKDTKKALIISPGIFFGFSKDLGLYSSVPDYGTLKKSSQYVEDFEIIDKYTDIFSIVQLTPSFNATDKPKGYANEFASQYTSQPLEIAILTKDGIHVYRYRTPDLFIDDSLDEKTFNKFGTKYGFDEACSSALYLACLFDKPDAFRNLATKFFISGGQNAKLNKNLPHIIDNVEPSDRFYGVLILISRLIRNIWNKEVFKLRDEIKFTRDGYVDIESIKKLKENSNVILNGLNISKDELEYSLSSILIVIKFFEDNKKIIPGLTNVNNLINLSVWNEKNDDLSVQAEQICFNSISNFLTIIKEGLSFLTILLEENENSLKGNTDVELNKYFNIVNYLSVQMQVDLSCLTFKDFFTKSEDDTSKLIKELLSSVINKAISRGTSVELVANSLQEKCGSFCSTGDVLVFKAIEKLKQAKQLFDNQEKQQLGINPTISQNLKDATDLLKQTGDLLSEETIVDCLNIILQLEYFEGAVSFILDLANTPEQIKFSNEYQIELHTQMLLDPVKKKIFDRKMKLYSIIFKILTDLDKKAITSVENAQNNTLISANEGMIPHRKGEKVSPFAPAIVDSTGQWVTHYTQMRDSCNSICLKYKDKMFHYEFYQWFIKNGIGEKLLYIDTPYILDFLKSNANKNLELSQLLWVYYSKRGNFFEAAKVLYDLSLSKFDIKLVNRFKYLSIANNFINGIESQYVKNEVVELGTKIEDLIAVSNLQDELINTTQNDKRLSDLAKRTVEKQLSNTILTMNDIYNQYIDPMGYYELALVAFKVSDHRNREDILSKWESLFDKWRYQYEEKVNEKGVVNEPFYVDISSKFTLMAQRVKEVDALLPIVNLIELLLKSVYDNKQSLESGIIVDSFIKSGVDYGKLYYNMKDLLESTTYEVFEGYSQALKGEMKYLIEKWFQNDKKLREVISSEQILQIKEYSLQKDPILQYVRRTGHPL